jgi:hypothetical protein
MIVGLDHVVLLLDDIEAGAKAYELLLGRAASWRSERDGAATVHPAAGADGPGVIAFRRHCERSEAIQRPSYSPLWIASLRSQ